MPAFFVITGFCSNFNKPFGTFFWQNFKTLKIPAIIFGTFLALVTMINHHSFSVANVGHHLGLSLVESGLWFLDALFLAKILYWVLLKMSHNRVVLALLCFCVFLVGLLLFKNNIPNNDYGNVCHAFMLTLFLCAGHQLKGWDCSLLVKTIVGGGVFVSTLVLISLLEIKVPYITNKISIDWVAVIPFLLLSLAGSLAILGLSELIGKNKWLEYVGRNSLVFYMFNTFALNISVKLLSKYMTSHLLSVALYLIVMALTCAILIVVTKIINTKYLRFTLGKF
jgi:fucose 4-O-acetylase-like acetyltransferase